MKKNDKPNQNLAASITKAASKQTYYTIRFLVDKKKDVDAYRAYAYFRWVDDWLDQEKHSQTERIAFLERQKMIVNSCYRGQQLTELSAEESMVTKIIEVDRQEHSGLQAYIRNMMAVMTFDAERRGQLISQEALNEYTHFLAVAVTEALHYFIGHECFSPDCKIRYQAATGAHITHMLRDTIEDIEAGYFNIPREVLEGNAIEAHDINRQAYRDWVEKRAQLARTCFKEGREYLTQVENFRCRVAGHAYIARFESILDMIEQDGYHIRAQYPKQKLPNMIVTAFSHALKHNHSRTISDALPTQ